MRIRGLPGGDLGLEQEELGRPAPARARVDLADPGIHAVGIGLQRALVSASSCAATDCSARP